MSQSSNSGSDMNIFSKISSIVADNEVKALYDILTYLYKYIHQINISTIERALKRSASIDLGNETKKVMTDSSSDEKQFSNTVSKAAAEPKFISARMMISSTTTNIETIPEISDEELLQMALDFEQKHGQ